MEIDQLKLILETIGAAGDGALWFGILWLSKGIVIAGLWIGLLWYFLRTKFTPFIYGWQLLQSIKDYMGYRGELTTREGEKILNTIKFADDVLMSAGLSYPTGKQRDKLFAIIREHYNK